MGASKGYRISKSLREKGYDLLSRYEPSDLAYTLGASIYDRMNKMRASTSQAHSKEESKTLNVKKDLYFKAAKRLLASAKQLKMLELQY